MKKFLLSVVIATLSSVAYGQLTYVGEVPNNRNEYGNSFYGKSWKVIISFSYESSTHMDIPIVNAGEDVSYIRTIYGDTIDYYDLEDNFTLKRRIIVPGNPQYVSAVIELPRGLYKNDNKDYMLICRNIDYENKDFSVYERNDTSLTLVQTLLTDDFDGRVAAVISNGSNVYLSIGMSKRYYYKFSGTISSNVSQPQADKNGLAAYPNPSHDKITLAYQTTTTATSIRICDVNGRLVERIPVNSNSGEYTLNVSNYPEGVYFYEINGKSSSFMVK